MEKTKPRRVEKPWGHELIWAETDGYVGKLLHVEAGEILSLQYHEVKDEVLHLLRGSLQLLVGRSPEDPDDLSEVSLEPGESVHIPPRTLHRVEAVTDCDILEASTPELDDVVRLKDRYGRAPRG